MIVRLLGALVGGFVASVVITLALCLCYADWKGIKEDWQDKKD